MMDYIHLMIYHNIYNSWAWVGGHSDGDEDLLHVIKKEIEEETGLTNVNLLKNGIYGINIVTVDNHIKKGNIVNLKTGKETEIKLPKSNVLYYELENDDMFFNTDFDKNRIFIVVIKRDDEYFKNIEVEIEKFKYLLECLKEDAILNKEY